MSSHRRTRRARDTDRTTGDGSATAWTITEIQALGATTDLATAASILGMSRSQAYKLIRRGAFPVPHFNVGARYRVPVAPILAALHLTFPASATTDVSAAALAEPR